MSASDSFVDRFFAPRGIVLIGPSRDSHKLGYGVARNLTGGGYQGAVHFVNPHVSGDLFGHEIYPTVADVPDPVDLAVVLVPAASVPDILEQCRRRSIGAVVVASGGFREAGPVGAALEARCVEIARESGMRMLGPNCIGVIDTHLGLNTTFLAPPGPEPGEVAFVSQSGALCAAVIDWSSGRGLGLSRLVSLGNQADIDESDALQMVSGDRATRVVTMYLESVADGRRFIEQVANMGQPVVALKAGSREAGRQAVVSHTGALAGREEAYRAAFRRAGVIQVGTTEAMLDAARALAWAPLPAGRQMAVLTNAGGPGVAATDALEIAGVEMAELSDETRSGLADALPAGAGVANPVDMLASARPEDFARSLETVLSAPEVHGVLVVIAPPPMFPADQVVEALVPVIDPADKPVLVTVMGDKTVGVSVDRLRTSRIPEYRFPEGSAAALAVLADRAERLDGVDDLPPRPADIDRTIADRILSKSAPGWLDLSSSVALLDSYGVATPPFARVRSADAAVEAVAGLGGPVAMKIDTPDLLHKSDVGGVRLNLIDPADVRAAYDDLVALAPQDTGHPATVCVQAMIETGQEVIVGGIRDVQFGPLILFGSGGVEVEGLGDVEFAIAPATGADLSYLLTRTWAGRRLKGYRNLPAGDEAAVRDLLIRVGWLIEDQPLIGEIEINPARVLSSGSGAIAIDIRLRLIDR